MTSAPAAGHKQAMVDLAQPTAKASKGKQAAAKKLPQTGNEANRLSLLGGLGLALTTLFGLGKKRKRGDDAE